MKMAQIQSQIPKMDQFRLKVGPESPNTRLRTPKRAQSRLESRPRTLKMAQIQAQDPWKWPKSSPRSPKWVDLGLK